MVYIIYTSRYTPPPLLWICTYPVNILIQRCSAVQLSSAGFSRHPTATTGPISQGGISGHKQEARPGQKPLRGTLFESDTLGAAAGDERVAGLVTRWREAPLTGV